jgi:hypothetical protein
LSIKGLGAMWELNSLKYRFPNVYWFKIGTYKQISNFEYTPVLPGTYIFLETNIASWKHEKMVLT